MSLTLSEVRAQKSQIASRLGDELCRAFNLAAINVSHGVTRHPDGGYDFAMRLTNPATPEISVGQNIVDYAREKIKEWVPGSQPDVRATGHIKPQ